MENTFKNSITELEDQSKEKQNEIIREQSKLLEQQKKQLEEQNIQLASIIENLSEGVMVADNKGEIIMANSEAKRLIYKCDKGTTIEDTHKNTKGFDMKGNEIPIQDFPSFRALRGERVKNSKIHVKYPGKEYYLDISSIPIYNSNKDLTMIVSCFHDISRTVEQSKKIEEQKKELEAIIENISTGISIIDSKGQYIFSNKSEREMYFPFYEDMENANDRYKQFELYDINGEKIDPEDITSRRVMRGEKFKNMRMSVKLPDKTLQIDISGTPIYDSEGKFSLGVLCSKDMTDYYNHEQVMERALKTQGEFLVNISHELKTPLNVIFSTVQLFEMYSKNGTLAEMNNSIIKYLDPMKQNCYRLSKLINNIVDLSKIEAGFFELHLSNNNIVDVVEEIVMSVTALIDSKGLNIIFDTNVEEKVIACDPEKIERIVLNLISNAMKFSNSGDEIFVQVNDMDEFVEISVKDNGIGIEDKYLNMIFDRFKQVDKSLSRKAEGTGIGLNLVKSIVELHGGSIHVESEFGKGSKFIVILPSKNVPHENMLYNSNMSSRDENIQAELSDVR